MPLAIVGRMDMAAGVPTCLCCCSQQPRMVCREQAKQVAVACADGVLLERVPKRSHEGLHSTRCIGTTSSLQHNRSVQGRYATVHELHSSAIITAVCTFQLMFCPRHRCDNKRRAGHAWRLPVVQRGSGMQPP